MSDETRDWAVIHGTILNTTQGGGFELFGPYTEDEARRARAAMQGPPGGDYITLATQLLHYDPTASFKRKEG